MIGRARHEIADGKNQLIVQVAALKPGSSPLGEMESPPGAPAQQLPAHHIDPPSRPAWHSPTQVPFDSAVLPGQMIVKARRWRRPRRSGIPQPPGCCADPNTPAPCSPSTRKASCQLRSFRSHYPQPPPPPSAIPGLEAEDCRLEIALLQMREFRAPDGLGHGRSADSCGIWQMIRPASIDQEPPC